MPEVAKALLEKNVDVNGFDKVRIFIQHFCLCITQEGNSPLLWAIRNNSSEVAIIMLKKGAEKNIKDKVWNLHNSISGVLYPLQPDFLEKFPHSYGKMNYYLTSYLLQ